MEDIDREAELSRLKEILRNKRDILCSTLIEVQTKADYSLRQVNIKEEAYIQSVKDHFTKLKQKISVEVETITDTINEDLKRTKDLENKVDLEVKGMYSEQVSVPNILRFTIDITDGQPFYPELSTQAIIVSEEITNLEALSVEHVPKPTKHGDPYDEDNKKYASNSTIICKHQDMVTFIPGCNYHKNTLVSLNGLVCRIKFIQGELWCLTDKEIIIYTANCKVVRSVPLERILKAQSFDILNSVYIIVCTSNQGIQLLNIHGKFIKLIALGKFADCKIDGNKLYALKYDERKLLIFETSDTQEWHLTKTIKLGYLNGSHLDTITVNKSLIYICSWNNNCLYCYRQNDVILELEKTDEGDSGIGLLKRPRLAGGDNSGHLTIADCENQRLLLRSRLGDWSVVSDVEIEGEIYDVVHECNFNTIWVVLDKYTPGDSLGKSTLLKLIKKQD